ncbi:hypothetical protein CERSUDRAFT_52053 [Gelatoporia subvermispora B]|uniref:CxC2-like cysteine cluster KDZ transposase-associated domain-containing protein n=1 Tax=Ceriporiopsis subvermispora (strain B) TaxID=914234 RepID=M2QH52_CERS8|nr:hypothetical protein CERSUDRAFT_52053 [Gelatoporia subvermispora B]
MADGGAGAYRCTDCVLPPLLCSGCTVQGHKHNPFHRQEKWDVGKACWIRQTLGELGLVINLWHRGDRCLAALPDARRVTVVHNALQLIAHGLWPGTWEKPATVFTVEVLKDFHLMSLQAQITAQDFYQYLRRRTDNTSAHHEIRKTQDRYRELLFATQEFIWLRAVKRAGAEPIRGMASASLAILCPSCPQPGMNLEPTWRARPEAMRYLEALYTTMDGNFQQNQREKPSDPNDFALSEGAAYFADTDDFKIYQADLGPLEREVRDLATVIAWQMIACVDRRVRYGGRVSGTVGLSCARHMFVLPGGGVDLQKGERFANVDFATISGLQRWMQCLLLIAGYDINCQYRKNFEKRMEWFRAHQDRLRSIRHARFPMTLSVIGKFHLPAHTASCRYKFSYYWMPGAAMTDGEAPERIWAVLNSLACRTREMAVGHRHDIINDHHSDMNVRRTHDMGEC